MFTVYNLYSKGKAVRMYPPPAPQCTQPARLLLLVEEEDAAGDAQAGTVGEEG